MGAATQNCLWLSIKLACWNVRCFHKPIKQRGVQSIVSTNKIDIFDILESKFDDKSLQSMFRIRFQGMKVITTFRLIPKVVFLSCGIRGLSMLML